MASIDNDTLRRLRGRLGDEDPDRAGRGPGARGLEHMARNRRCQRLTAVTLAGASADAAARRLGVPNRSEEASPFAAARGGRFEDHLFQENCRRLWEMYVRQGLLPADFPLREDLDRQWMDTEYPEGKDSKGEFSLAERRRLSEELVLRRASGDLTTPALILKPRFVVRAAGQEFTIEPDALIASPGERAYRVAEIKSYADRRGYTDQSKTSSAARQAAVGVVALRQLLSAEGHTETVIETTADLIFSNSGSNTPTLNRLDITGEVANLTDALDNASAQLEEVLRRADGRSLDEPDVLMSLDTYLCGACSTHCPMFEHCRTLAIEHGAPVTLGDAAQELLTSVGSLERAIQLRDGTVTPNDDDEAAVADLLGQAYRAFEQATTAPTLYDQAIAAGDEEQDLSAHEDVAPLYASDADEDTEDLEVAA